VVIDWINGSTCFQVKILCPLMCQIRDFTNMDYFNCKYILHKLNGEAELLSKEALEMDDGDFFMKEFHDDHFINEFNIIL